MSKCFIRAVMPLDFACLMAARLLAYMVVVPSVGSFVLSVYGSGFPLFSMSSMIWWSQSVSRLASVNAVNSASLVEKATRDRFFED